MNETRGYHDGWLGIPPAVRTGEYRRGYAEGCDHRRRADLRRDGSSYSVRISTWPTHPIGAQRERTEGVA